MGDYKIREGLLQAGWATADVEEAMAKAPAVSASQTKPKAMMSKTLAVIFVVIAIAVGGYFAGAYYASKFQNFPLWPFEVGVPVPTFTPRPSPTNLEAKLPSEIPSDWKTYRNEEYGFEFKYPGDWKVDECDQKIILINGICYSDFTETGAITISDDLNLEYQTNLYDQYSQEWEQSQKNQIIIDNISAIKFFGIEGNRVEGPGPIPGSKLQFILFNSRNHTYNISFAEKPGQNYLNIFDQILSTFRFIDQPDTSNWKTYRNEKYGFEFKYPGDWVIENVMFDCFWINLKENNKDKMRIMVNCSGRGLQGVESKEYQIGGVTAGEFIWRDSDTNQKDLLLVFSYSGNTFNIGGDGLTNADEIIFNQILSTFRFTK